MLCAGLSLALNRIKHLEALVESHKKALEDVQAENSELRAELDKSVDPEEAAEQAAEVAALRELLVEREQQVLSLSRRLSDAFEGGPEPPGRGRSPGGMRRESFLERFNLGGPKGLLASSA